MRRLVVDTSALAALFFPEPLSGYVEKAVEQCGECHAVEYAPYEFANVVRKRVARRELRLDEAEEVLTKAFELLSTFTIHGGLAREAFQEAVKLDITVYDAALVAVARKVRGKILTTDMKLANSLRARGLGHLVAAPQQ